MREPLLYASLFLEAHRREYYDRLQAVREHGNWESWVRFFLEGVIASAEQAVLTARALLELVERNRNAMRGAPMNLAVLEALQQRPIATVNDLQKKLKSTYPTISKALEQLQRARIITELTGQRRNRLFAYAPYIAILNVGAEPLKPGP